MKTVVVSDVHLAVHEAGQPTMERFIAFLRQLEPSEISRLIILGDLFDFWFEYRHVVFSGYFDVLRALADLRDGGVEMHFICGNHDFWAGRFLREELAFTIHDGAAHLPFGGRRVMLVHGDGLNPRDWSYRLYKRIARLRIVVGAFRLIHPDWAMKLAQWVSHGSRKLHADDLRTGAEIKPLQDFARRALAEGRADVVMCGHSHHPTFETHPTPEGTGVYINTGDWLEHESYVEWDGEDFRLLLWGDPPEEIPCREGGGPEDEASRKPE